MFKKLQFLLIGVLFIIPICFRPQSVFASQKETIVFEEDFSFIDHDKWVVYDYENNISTASGLILSSSNSEYYPFLHSRNNIIPTTGNFFIEVEYVSPGIPSFGVGFGLGNQVPVYGLRQQTLPDSDIIQFLLWFGGSDGHLLQTNRCPELNLCDGFRTNLFAHPYTNDENTLRIEYAESDYKIFLNNVEVLNNSLLGINRRPTVFWIGNYAKLDTKNYWTNLTVKNIKVGSYADLSSISTVVVPGLGASWDIEAMLLRTEGTKWEVPSFVNNYDGLVNSFLNAGLVDEGVDKNLFVFPYDWRKPLDVLSDRLDQFITDNIPTGTKVNIVGHSMGGLVARSYAQEHGTARINKIVEVGSPNMGVLEAYGVWEGATVWNDSWWTKLALELSTHFGAVNGETKLETLRRVAPSIKDLLPTYDFLVFDGSIVPWSALSQKNEFLNNLNQDISSIDSFVTTIVSNEIPTNSKLKVTTRNAEDGDLWFDGKPTDDPFITLNGDGVVSEISARGLFSNNIYGSGWHGELVTKEDNIKKIFGVLGLDESKALSNTVDDRNNAFVAVIKSPGELEVCDQGDTKCNDELGLYFPDHKMFILPDYNNENLIVRVKEDGTGDYTLHLGNIRGIANWTEVEGSLDFEGELDQYDVESEEDVLTATLFDDVAPTTPVITGFKNPELACGSITNKKYITVDWTDSTDNIGLDGYEYYIDYPLPGGIGRGIWNPTNLWKSSENYGSLNEGVHRIKVRAKDLYGNVSEWSNICEITYDSIKPVLTTKSEFSGWYNSPQISVFEYSDVNMVDDYADPSCEIETEGKNQTCTVSPSVCDKAGNCNTDEQVSNGANIDMTPPSAPKVVYANDFGQRVFVNWWPVHSAVKYRVYVGSKKNNLIAVADTRFSYWLSGVMTPGKYYVSVTALDRAGNESLKSRPVHVNVSRRWWKW